MDIDLDMLAGALNETARQIKEASTKSAQEALPFIPKIMEQLQNLPSFRDLKDINVEASDPKKLEDVYAAIQDVIANTKEMQQHPEPIIASLLDSVNEQMNNMRDMSELVYSILEQKGRRVERKEQEGL